MLKPLIYLPLSFGSTFFLNCQRGDVSYKGLSSSFYIFSIVGLLIGFGFTLFPIYYFFFSLKNYMSYSPVIRYFGSTFKALDSRCLAL